MPTVGAVDPMTLWYLARASGLVLLGLLTLNLALGIAIQGGWHPRGWPRFVVQGLHRNLALTAVVLLVIHVVTIELDPFVPVGWWAVLVPFVSPYRPLWLGLGTLSLDLLAAVIVTSLLRAHLRPRLWRAVHWLAYLSWPVALLHSVGTGTDTRLGAIFVYEMACVGLLAATVIFRLARAAHPAPVARGLLMVAAAAAPLAALAWSASGPLQAGWAKKAGTPTAVLASGGTGTGAPSGAPSGGAGPAETAFTASFSGSAISGGGGQTLTITGRVQGGAGGSLQVVLQTQPLSAGGLAVSSGAATYKPGNRALAYSGTLVGMRGAGLEFSLQAAGVPGVAAELVLSGPVPSSTVAGQLYFGTAPPTFSGGDDGGGGN